MNVLTNPTMQTVLEVYIGLMLYSALVQSLPNPSEVGGIWYKSLYNFLSILATDFKSFAKNVPEVNQLVQTSVQAEVKTDSISTTSSTPNA